MLAYDDLNKLLNISEEDYKEIAQHADRIYAILSKYEFKRDSQYKDEEQTSMRDDVKNKFWDFRYLLGDFKNFCVKPEV